MVMVPGGTPIGPGLFPYGSPGDSLRVPWNFPMGLWGIPQWVSVGIPLMAHGEFPLGSLWDYPRGSRGIKPCIPRELPHEFPGDYPMSPRRKMFPYRFKYLENSRKLLFS